MSDLLNSASLVMIPSGYAEDKVYSVVPSDGSGDMTLTRASNGTRINSAGLVEVCPWNLLQYSEEFNNAYWTKNRSSITANSTSAPNGTTTADSLIEDTANGTHEFITVLATQLQSYNFSIYAKANTRSKIQLVLAGTPWATGGNGEASFDLSLGTIISAVNGATGTIENVGNGWYRCTIAKPSSVADPSGVLAVRLLDASGNSSYTGNGTSSAYLWGAQLNIGSTAKPYFPTTDRLNVPRLTYQNGGGGCPSLLLEKQSTNLCVQSNAFNTTPWAITSNLGTNPVITTNYGISPDGTQNASRVQLARTNANASYSQIFQYPVSVTSGQPYTWSVWLKSLSGTPTISIVGDFGRPPVTLTSEWVRYYGTGTAPTSIAQLEIAILGSTFSSGNSLTADFLIWGYQFEQSSYPTSYIPTTSSSATRVVDTCLNGGSSALFNSPAGVLFFEGNVESTSTPAGAIAITGSGGNRVQLYNDGANMNALVEVGGVLVFVSSTTGLNITQSHKYAISWALNDFTFYADGVQIGSISSGATFSASTLNQFRFSDSGANYFYGKVKQVVVFPSRLTNSQLIDLTN